MGGESAVGASGRWQVAGATEPGPAWVGTRCGGHMIVSSEQQPIPAVHASSMGEKVQAKRLGRARGPAGQGGWGARAPAVAGACSLLAPSGMEAGTGEASSPCFWMAAALPAAGASALLPRGSSSGGGERAAASCGRFERGSFNVGGGGPGGLAARNPLSSGARPSFWGLAGPAGGPWAMRACPPAASGPPTCSIAADRVGPRSGLLSRSRM